VDWTNAVSIIYIGSQNLIYVHLNIKITNVKMKHFEYGKSEVLTQMIKSSKIENELF